MKVPSSSECMEQHGVRSFEKGYSEIKNKLTVNKIEKNTEMYWKGRKEITQLVLKEKEAS